MTTTHTYPPEIGKGPKQKTPIFSMDNIPASAFKKNLELLDQPLSEDNHHVKKPTVIPASLPNNPTITVLLILSVLLHQMTFHITEGPVYLTDTRRT